VFVALFEEQLQAQAEPQVGAPGLDTLPHRIGEPAGLEVHERFAKRTGAWQHHAIGLLEGAMLDHRRDRTTHHRGHEETRHNEAPGQGHDAAHCA
jgi:hypothetical protein